MTTDPMILDFQESWPIWDLEKRVFETGVWIQIRHLVDLTGKSDAVYRLLQEIKRLDWTCVHDGIKGWLCAVRKGNAKMHRIVKLVGASAYAEDTDFVYYGRLAGLPMPTDMKGAVKYFLRGSDATH